MLAMSGCRSVPGPHRDVKLTTSTNRAAPQQIAKPCDEIALAPDVKLQDQHIRCSLNLNADLTIDTSSDPAWSFTVQKHGVKGQEFREPTDVIGETGAAPLLEDIDNSGQPVLLVVNGEGGTGGEPMAVWRPTGSSPVFVRAGQIFGQRRFYRTPEGFFGNYAHASAASGDVTLYRWVDDKLVDVAVLDMQAAAAPESRRNWVRNGNVLCALAVDGLSDTQTAALRAAGIDPATAQQRFCSQAWVATVYR